MDIKKLQTAVVDALEDVKAQDIKIYDTTHLTSLFDRVAIASGTSNRQTKALAASVRDKVKAKGGHVVSVEGEDTGEWVLVDLGDMIVHIMQPAIRAYYRLEEIWGDKEVKMGAAKRVASTAAAKKAAEDEKPTKMRRTREQAEAVEASQAIDDDETPKKPARKPRATAATTEAKPAPKTTRTPRASTTLSAAKTKAAAGTGTATKRKAPASKAVGKTVKVATPKSAVASKKAAAAKRPARPKAKA
ncbi:ribosome silencing factor [Herbaspirillum sp. meg3]|uniref:ribosome silencing factor n=1 Tax=Herbaspirillum sp. meg3 TaxID=2025949 RepID=UPI000B9903A1|nr:ribosome silencing factor [Herbaspirillum sp. meg3]ASU40139.1 ribosome silencing factor [Herbaspirillum sp. meg3]